MPTSQSVSMPTPLQHLFCPTYKDIHTHTQNIYERNTLMCEQRQSDGSLMCWEKYETNQGLWRPLKSWKDPMMAGSLLALKDHDGCLHNLSLIHCHETCHVVLILSWKDHKSKIRYGHTHVHTQIINCVSAIGLSKQAFTWHTLINRWMGLYLYSWKSP